jgi:hypothetical protein
MADVSVAVGAAREETAARTTERFLTWPRAAAVAVFLLFALTFDEGQVHDDGLVYFDFLRRLFGAGTVGVAYQFGSAFWNIPFYLASQLVATRGALDHFHAAEISVTVASHAATVGALYFGWRILRELDLPRGAAVLLLTLFGTPLYYYGALWTGYKHAADTLYATALFWFVLRCTRKDARRRDLVGAGICLALLLVTRYANFAMLAGVVAVFAYYRLWRAVAWMLAVAAVSGAVLFAVPVVRHIPYATPPSAYAQADRQDRPALPGYAVQREAMGKVNILSPVLHNSTFGIWAPVKMLFTLRRGLFIWTPLTAFATVGFVLLALRDRRHRPFLLALGASAFGLLVIHVFWGGGAAWTGGGSFSQRFLTALFPFFLLGTAEFVRRTRWPGVAVLTLCALFSVWIGLTQFNGYYRENGNDSIVPIIQNYHSFLGPPRNRFHPPPPYDSIQNFGRQMVDRTEHRWELYWRLVD